MFVGRRQRQFPLPLGALLFPIVQALWAHLVLYSRGDQDRQPEFLENWTNDHSKAFEKVRQAVTEATLLVNPMDNARTEIWTDASDKGIGAVLMQFQNNGWVPLAYWSKPFNNGQKSYSAFEKVFIAVSYTVDHFRCYVESVPIVVRTDHKPLVST